MVRMIKGALKFGLLILVLVAILMPFQGCTKQAIIQEDISKATPSSQQPETEQVLTEDNGELAKLGGRVSEEAEDKKGNRPSLKDYFVVSTPDGDYIFYDIHFDFDKYTLRPEDREALSRYAKWLLGNRKYAVTIEGHCDEVGTAEYNLALGERRADAARRYLMDLGVEGKRIKTVSYGEEYPLDPAQNDSAYAKNRRAHFVVSLEK